MLGDKVKTNRGLSDEAVKEYIQVYEAEYGEEIDFNEAKIQATEFLELIRFILSPPIIKI